MAVDFRTAILVDDDTLLLHGQTSHPLPKRGTVRSGSDGAQSGAFHCLTFAGAEGRGALFVAVVKCAGLAQLDLSTLAIEAQGAVLRHVTGGERPIRANPRLLLRGIRSASPESLPAVAGFLAGVLVAADRQPPGPDASKLLQQLLRLVSRPAGVIEILGPAEGVGTLLQGWSRESPDRRRPFVVEADDVRCQRAIFAAFDRSDLRDGARGFVGLVETKRPIAASVRRIYFVTSKGWGHLERLDDARVLEPADTGPHLSHMTTRLDGDPDMLRAFRRLASGRFDGHDTVNALDRPVRIGIDCAVRLPGAGLFLSGWVLDPAGYIEELRVQSTSGYTADVKSHWSRLDRADVNDAFANEPLFAAHLTPDRVRHGFQAFLPGEVSDAADEVFYLEIVLTDDRIRFMPLAPSRGASPATIRRLLANFDANAPEADRIIETHIGPFIHAAAKQRQIASDQVVVSDFAVPGAETDVSVIVPLGANAADFDVNLARFAVDPDFESAEIVTVVPATVGSRVTATIRRLAGFYGLNVKLVLVHDAIDRCEGFDIGAQHARHETIVLLSPSVLPRASGWLSRLRAAFDGLGRSGVVSPTLLYEDDSIRFAGLRNRYDRALGAHLALGSDLAGYPRHWLAGRELTRVFLATVDCCVLSRRTMRDIGGFSPEFVADDLKASDFMLKARTAGVDCHWLPDVELIALDERGAEEGEYWFHNRMMVDGWGFDRKWSLFLANTKDE
ncbi:MAG TPA: hypothetical protein VFO41_14625 [Alphaproteobacteria bacterium]|nr:hypothetical protein [Alphaproteobacteria bacterium]